MVYLTLFGWSFLAATIIPLGSEPALAAFVRRDLPFWPLVLVATLGNYLGACTTYFLAKAAARALATRTTPSGAPAAGAHAARATRLMASRGAPILLLSWVPLIGDALVAAAGAAGTPFISFSIWTSAGKFLRYLAVAWAASAI